MDEARIAHLESLINQQTGMSPGVGACIGIVTVVILAVLIAMFMSQSPHAQRFLKKNMPLNKKLLNRSRRTTNRNRRKNRNRKIATTNNSSFRAMPTSRNQRQNSYNAMSQGKKLISYRTTPQTISSSTQRQSSVPSALQSTSNMQFTARKQQNVLNPIPNVSSSNSSSVLKLNNNPMYSSSQIEAGLNNAALLNNSPNIEITTTPSTNQWTNLWLHGDINSKQTKKSPVATQSIWAESWNRNI